MSIRPSVRRATVAGAVAALSLALVPALATTASAVAPPNVAFTYIVKHRPLIAGDGALRANPPGSLSTSSPLLPAGHYVYSFDVDESGDTAAYVVRTTDSRGDFFDTTSGLVVVDRGVSGTTTRRVATWVDTNPVVAPDGSKVWWMTDTHLYSYDVASTAVTDLGTTLAGADNATYYELPVSLAVSGSSGTAVAVLYDRYSSTTDTYLGSRVRAVQPANAAAANYNLYVADGTSGVPSSNTFVFTSDTTFIYDVNSTNAAGFDTKTANLGTGNGTTTAGIGSYYQVRKVTGTWYLWKDDVNGSSVGTTTDLATAPTDWVARPDGDSTVRYLPSTLTPPAVTALTSAKSAFSAFLSLSATSVLTGGKAYYLAGGQSAAVGPDPLPYGARQNFKGVLQYSLNGTTGWTYLKTTTGSVSTGPNGSGSYNGLTQALKQNTWFRWVHPADLFTNQTLSPVRKVSVKPIISISKVRSGTKTKVYGSIKRVGGTAILYRKSSTGAYVKVGQTTISSAGAYSFGYRSLARGTYRVTSVGDAKWAANTKNFTL